jgi:hypothetical protein
MTRKSIGAVAAGVFVIIAATTLVDILFHVVGVFPPMDQPINDWLALLATASLSRSVGLAARPNDGEDAISRLRRPGLVGVAT